MIDVFPHVVTLEPMGSMTTQHRLITFAVARRARMLICEIDGHVELEKDARTYGELRSEVLSVLDAIQEVDWRAYYHDPRP